MPFEAIRGLFLLQEGSLLDEVNRREQAHDPFQGKEILHIFLQVMQPITYLPLVLTGFTFETCQHIECCLLLA